MNKKNLKVINEFANDNAINNDKFDVIISEYNTCIKPLVDSTRPYYEDCCLLHDLIRGAEHFIFFLERNGYIIKKGKLNDK